MPAGDPPPLGMPKPGIPGIAGSPTRADQQLELELVLDPDTVTVAEELPASGAAAARHSRLLSGDRVTLATRLTHLIDAVTEDSR